jgi:hypothetical protein
MYGEKTDIYTKVEVADNKKLLILKKKCTTPRRDVLVVTSS